MRTYLETLHRSSYYNIIYGNSSGGVHPLEPSAQRAGKRGIIVVIIMTTITIIIVTMMIIISVIIHYYLRAAGLCVSDDQIVREILS